MPNKTPSTAFAWAAIDAAEEMNSLKSKIPSHKEIRRLMTSRANSYKLTETLEGLKFTEIDIKDVPDWVKNDWAPGLKRFSIESHHGIPRVVQGWFGIPAEYWDDAPALLTTMMKHRGAGGESVHAVIARNLADAMRAEGVPDVPETWPLNLGRPIRLSNEQIQEAIKTAYGELDLKHFWNESVDFMESHGVDSIEKF